MAPAHLRAAISAGEPVDYDELMVWWDTSCPERLRRLSPDTAAVLSAVTRLADPDARPQLRITYQDRD